MNTKTNFKVILEQLCASGLSDIEIAEIVGTNQPTITRLRRGVHDSTRYDLGARIVDLHKRRCNKKTMPPEPENG